MDPHLLDGITALIVTLFVICCIAVPLGLWKLADLAIYVMHHVSIH